MKIKQLFTTPKDKVLVVDEDGVLYHMKDKNTPGMEEYELMRVPLEIVYPENGVLKRVKVA